MTDKAELERKVKEKEADLKKMAEKLATLNNEHYEVESQRSNTSCSSKTRNTSERCKHSRQKKQRK